MFRFSPLDSALPIGLAALLMSCASSGNTTTGSVATTASATTSAACAPDNAGLTLPAGFCATVFADSLGRARYVTVAANGDVYVAIEGTRPAQQGQAPPPPPRGAF